MTDHLTITDRVLQADEVAVERFLKAVRRATRHHGEDALLADMLDHMVAHYEGDDAYDKAYAAAEMSRTAHKLERCAELQEREESDPYGDGIKLRRVDE